MNPEDTTTLKSFSPRTKKILGSILAAGIILAGALFIYALLVGPSRAPYRDALVQYTNFKDTNAIFLAQGSSLGAGTVSNEQYDKNVKTMQKTLDSLQIENEALATKAVLAEGEGQKLYKALNVQLQKYINYYEGDLKSMAVLRPIMFVCLNKLENLEESADGASEMQSCAQSFVSLNLEHDDYTAVAEGSAAIYRDIARNVTEAAMLTDTEGANKAKYQALLDEREVLLKDLEQVGVNFNRSLQTHRSEVDITKEAMALEAYLDDKSSVF